MAKGVIVGGNLSVLCGMLGSNSFPETDGKIFFVEEIDEYIYHVERMMYALKRAGKLDHLMQPEMSYEKGFCRPECTRCSELCPAGAIEKISREEKTQYHIGTAQVNLETCVSATEKANCGKCSRSCPVGAIQMVKNESSGALVPVVAEEICIGCGACEQLCPVRPISAITVNGRHQHV